MRRTFQPLTALPALAGLMLLCAGTVAAQGGSISGNVLLPGGGYLNEAARINLENGRGVRSSVFTDNHGHFEFRGLTPATYQIVIEADANRFEVTTVTVEVFPNAPSILNITLKEKKSGSKGTGHAVSAGELDPSIPSKARKEFDRATEAMSGRRIVEAIAHLRKAIE